MKGDESIELKFKEYKNETSKIINDLKLQVNYLKTTLGNFEETTKQKDKLYNEGIILSEHTHWINKVLIFY